MWLIFERIREELKTAKGPARAIELGYQKALSAILDANITTAITAAILFIMGSGPVKGFAVTLFFGIITSLFTAYFVTRLIIIMWFERRRPKTMRCKRHAFEAGAHRNQDRLFQQIADHLWGVYWRGGPFCCAVLVMGLNFGIDFKGGTTIRTQSAEAVDVGDYRAALSGLGLGEVTITQVFDPTFGPEQNVAMVRIEAQEGDEAVAADTVLAVEAALQLIDPDMTFPSVESVGPKVSGRADQKGHLRGDFGHRGSAVLYLAEV